MVELALILQLDERLHRLLKGHITGDARRLEQIDLLSPTKGRINSVDAAPQVLWTAMCIYASGMAGRAGERRRTHEESGTRAFGLVPPCKVAVDEDHVDITGR